MSLFTRLLAILLLSVILAACAAAPAATPPSVPTTAPKAAEPTRPAATTAPSPTTGTASPTAAATSTAPATTTAPATATSGPAASTPATTPSTLPALAPGQVRFTIVPADTEARYRVKEQLAGQSLPNDAVGATKDVSGQIVVDAAGKVVKESSKITVKITNLVSDRGQRDNFIRQSTLETSRFPEVVLVPTEVRGLPSPLPASGEVKFDLVGDLTIKGITKSVTWKSEARVDGNGVRGKTETEVKFGDFGMTQPRVAVVVSVEDSIKLELTFHLSRGAS